MVSGEARSGGLSKWLRDQGGTIWHIRRPSNPHALNTNHESEKPIVPLDGEPFLINDGNIVQLYGRTVELLQTEETT